MAATDHPRLYDLVGERVRRAREAKKMSQAELARRLGLSRVSVVNIENGRQRPPLHVVWDAAEVLGMEPRQLIPLQADLADGAYEVQLDASTARQIEAAAKDDPAARRRLTEFIQLAKSKLDGRTT